MTTFADGSMRFERRTWITKSSPKRRRSSGET